jgi:hypothetical protein
VGVRSPEENASVWIEMKSYYCLYTRWHKYTRCWILNHIASIKISLIYNPFTTLQNIGLYIWLYVTYKTDVYRRICVWNLCTDGRST